MINKNINTLKLKIKEYKNVIKNNRFIKSIFFLKYIILIFIISTIVYLVVPKFLNFENKIIYLKKSLNKNYNLNIINIEKINYKIFPSPRLILKKSTILLNKSNTKVEIKNLVLILDFFKLYKFNDLELIKIVLIQPNLIVKTENLKNILRYIDKVNNEMIIEDGNLLVSNKKIKILSINKFSFNNKNKEKIKFNSIIFGHKFNAIFLERRGKKNLTAIMPDFAFKTNVAFAKNSSLDILKDKIETKFLKNNLKFNFIKNDKLIISNSFFRNKLLQTTFDGTIETNPFFNFDLFFIIKSINFTDLLNSENIKKILNFSGNAKKLNGKIKILYNKNNLERSYVKNLSASISSENGSIKLNEITVHFPEAVIYLNGDISEYEGYTKFNFKIIADVTNKKKFLRNFKIKGFENQEPLNLSINGYLNISSNKIYFDLIEIDNKKKTSVEDINFYKQSFEQIVIKDNLKNIFIINNIKNFFKEIL